MAGYIGTTPVPQATQHRESFTATGGQTSFATVGYTPQFIDVYLNGVKLAPADFTATNGSDVVLASGATASDILEIVAYTPFEVANQTFTGTTTAANLTVTGAFTSQGIDDNADAVAITIDSSENVGIGTSSPSGASGKTLAINGGSGQTRLALKNTSTGDASGDGFQISIGTDGSAGIEQRENNYMAFLTNAAERMRIDSSGRVSIGGTTVTDVNMLNIQGSGASSNIGVVLNDTNTSKIYGIQNGGSQLKFHDYSASATRMTIDSSGNLLVGKTSANATDLGIVANASGRLYATANGATSIFNRTTSDGDIIDFRKDGTAVGSIGTGGGRPYFVADNGSNGGGFKVDSTQFYPVDRTGAVSNGVLDLGYSSGRWKDLYLSGGVFLGGNGSANKLDDYEEGTWTPVSDYGTLTSVTATYTKIGNSVFIRLACTMPSTSSSSVMAFAGLPFSAVGDGSAKISFTTSANYNPAIILQGTSCYFYAGSGTAVAASNYSGSIVRFAGHYNTTS